MTKSKRKYGYQINYAKFLLSQGLDPCRVKFLVELAFPELKKRSMEVKKYDDLTTGQRRLINKSWFVFGNYGKKT